MVLVRLAYASALPTPEEAIRALNAGESPRASTPPQPAAPTSAPRASAPSAPSRPGRGELIDARVTPVGVHAHDDSPARPSGMPRTSAVLAQPVPMAAPKTEQPVAAETAQPPALETPKLETFAQVVALAQARKEGRLAGHLARDVHLVRFESGRIEFRPGAHAPDDLARQLSGFLHRETGRTWLVGVSSAAGDRTLAEEREAARAALRAEIAEHPFVKAVQSAFPGARIEDVRAPEFKAPDADLGAGEEPDGE
jgi:DNA polymerase-3 subunit gamma/tau